MSTTTVFRIAGVSGILAALAMLALTFVSDPNSGMSPVYAVPNAVLGIIFVAGLYLLYRDQESALSLAAAAASVIGYLLFLAGSFMQLTYPSPILQAGDILIYIIGLSLFSWLAYRGQDAAYSGHCRVFDRACWDRQLSCDVVYRCELHQYGKSPATAHGAVHRLSDRGGRLAGLDGS